MNTIEEKAKELVLSFTQFTGERHEVSSEDAKECALICVDEKIVTLNMVKELYGAALKSVWKKEDEMVEAFRYWCDNSISDLEQVKEKIQSL